jgi:hypothetical protein
LAEPRAEQGLAFPLPLQSQPVSPAVSPRNVTMNLKNIADDQTVSNKDLIVAYGHVLGAMRKRGIIRTKNVVGDLGESYAELEFSGRNDLPSLKLVPTNEKDIDAVDAEGKNYSIKSASKSSAKRTSAMHLERAHKEDDKRFDYLLIVVLEDSMELSAIYQFSWDQFWKLKSWSEPQKAWFLSLAKKNLDIAKKIF